MLHLLLELIKYPNVHMWDNYTPPNLGVALEFEIVNNVDDWEKFYFASVKYGELEDIEVLDKNLIELGQKHPNCDFKIQLEHLLAFHKEKIDKWEKEKELRILGVFPYTNRERRIKVNKDFKNNSDGNGDRETEYIEVPLWLDKEFIKTLNKQDPCLMINELGVKNMPILKLTNIYFKNDFVLKEKWRDFCEELGRFTLWKLGYRIRPEIIDVN